MNTTHPENHTRIIKSISMIKNKFGNNLLKYDSEQIKDYLKEIYKIKDLDTLAKNFLKNSYNNKYLDNIKKECDKLDIDEIVDGDTYFSKLTYGEVIDGSLIMFNACNQIMNKVIKYAYCLIRPPSHHSTLNYYSGFCFVNQTYQTAKYLHDKFKQKVFILDYDVHHGDGTQDLVNKNFLDEIYFCSIHCYAPYFYPGTGTEDENNEKVLNIPLATKSSDKVYIDNFDNKIVPYIQKVNPDIIIISNGFDAHKDDPMKVMSLTEEFYVHVNKYLKSLNKPIIYILEGGYNPEIIGKMSCYILDILIEK
jgi:acetoin utilization deacetylase AcuC-like enzyme